MNDFLIIIALLVVIGLFIIFIIANCWKHNRTCLSEQKDEKYLLVKDKIEMNVWDHIDDFLKVYEKMKKKEWSWIYNTQCKYVELRIDMRDGCCLIHDKDGKRINPEDLAYQLKVRGSKND